MTNHIGGNLFILAAPSGTGKTSLVKALLEKNNNLIISTSHTTRPPRKNEINGKDYFFVEEAEFKNLIKKNYFIEHAKVFGNYYGTSRALVQSKLEAGKAIILEIDWQGAEQICNLYPDACSIFILPPSIETLTERLQERAQDDYDTIESRMQQARSVIEHVAQADYVVVNDDFDSALDDIRAIVRTQRLTVRVQQETLSELLTSLTHG